MTDLTPHMTPTERKRYAALQVVSERGEEARVEMSKIKSRVRARLKRARLKRAAGKGDL